LAKSDLGDEQDNATDISINLIYANDTVGNEVTSSPSLSFDYAQTSHSSNQSVSEVYNSVSDAVSWTADYNETTTYDEIGGTCELNVFSSTYTMEFSSGSYSRTISTYQVTPAEYTWTINCTNSSFQSQGSSGNIIVRSGGAGEGDDGGGGGGGGGSYSFLDEEGEPEVVHGNTSFAIVRPYSGTAELTGKPGKKSSETCFAVKNTGTNNVTLTLGCDGNMCDWVAVTKPLGDTLQLDPGEQKDVCYYVDIPIEQENCKQCKAFKLVLVDPISHLYVSYISKWSFSSFSIREFILHFFGQITKLYWVGDTNKIPIPMIIFPLGVAMAIGFALHKAKFKQYSGLGGLIMFFVLLFAL
jgi:hypothetical protein